MTRNHPNTAYETHLCLEEEALAKGAVVVSVAQWRPERFGSVLRVVFHDSRCRSVPAQPKESR